MIGENLYHPPCALPPIPREGVGIARGDHWRHHSAGKQGGCVEARAILTPVVIEGLATADLQKQTCPSTNWHETDITYDGNLLVPVRPK